MVDAGEAVMRDNQLREKALNGYQEQFRDSMERNGRHVTRQRLSIAGVLYAMHGHPTIAELHDELKKSMPDLGLATVYRTVKMLKEAGLVMELRGEEDSARFEAMNESKHHDHFICRKCGTVIEVSCPELERAQSELARKYGFFPDEKAHCVYGLCSDCRSNNETGPSHSGHGTVKNAPATVSE